MIIFNGSITGVVLGTYSSVRLRAERQVVLLLYGRNPLPYSLGGAPISSLFHTYHSVNSHGFALNVTVPRQKSEISPIFSSSLAVKIMKQNVNFLAKMRHQFYLRVLQAKDC